MENGSSGQGSSGKNKGSAPSSSPPKASSDGKKTVKIWCEEFGYNAFKIGGIMASGGWEEGTEVSKSEFQRTANKFLNAPLGGSEKQLREVK